MSRKRKAVRTTSSLTASWERRHLPQIARRLPPWMTPDHLTTSGIIAAGVIGAGYLLSHLHSAWLLLSVFGLLVHWLADSLDGTLARVRHQERERYGYYVDRTADAISTVIICLCLGLSPFVRLPAALLLAVGYLLLQIYAEVSAYTANRFPLSFMRLGPTEVRIALGALSLALIGWRPPVFGVGGLAVGLLDIVFALLGLALIAVYSVTAIRGARRLEREEPMPSSGGGH